jgi:ABC-2 type transport system ATP-binding protein/lipopolysaccharide transport system ATP-binding protein
MATEITPPVTRLPDRDRREPVIVVDDVSKRFRLYKERATSLKEAITYKRKGMGARFDDFWALRNVSLEIERGTTYGLIGHNGSGKSTLLRLIAGIHPTTSGKVTTKGRISALLELGAGFHPELTGRENIYMNGSILGLKRREIKEVIDDIIEFAGIEQFIDSPVKVYSSGMYVRLGFSVAVHVQPDILLIDEVIAVGDEEFQRRCLEHLYKLRREGVTIVMVSHSGALMEAMCDRVAWLDHGELQAEGAAADVVRQYQRKVNQVENERKVEEALEAAEGEASENADAELDDAARNSATRRGSGEIRVDGLEFLDGSGKPSLVGSTGDPFVVRIHYTATEPIREPVFGLGFRHEMGQTISGSNTRYGQQVTGTVDGHGYIDYVLDRLPLMPGDWLLSAAIVDEHWLHTYDQIDESFPLHVQPGSSAERYGIVDLQGHWTAPSRDFDVFREGRDAV